MRAPIPTSEPERIAALHRAAILDTPPEEAFDEIVHLAAALCETPVALITLVDTCRQWFKAAVGVDMREAPRDLAFCAHAILSSEIMVVPDALLDPRFADNPLVVDDPHIRFYAGAPLVSAEGERLGTLCTVDHVPRRLDARQLASLTVLSHQVSALLELRRAAHDLSVQAEARRQLETVLRDSEERFQIFMENCHACASIKDSAGRYLYANPSFVAAIGKSAAELWGYTDAELWEPGLAAALTNGDADAGRDGTILTLDCEMPLPGGSRIWKLRKFGLKDGSGGRCVGCLGIDAGAAPA